MTKHEEALKKLKPGDRVRVMRQIERHADGWQNSWEPEMTRNIGKVFTIKWADGPSGVLFEEPSSGHRYPAHGLMLEHSLSGYFQKGDRVRVREKCKDYEHGWMQVWNRIGGAHKMEIGVVGTIVDVLGSTGVQLENGAFFPEWTLDHAPAEGAGVLVPVFKDGDTVRILRKPSRTDWGAVWTTHVDRTIGETGKIVARYGTKGAKDDRYCVLLSSNGRYPYPPEVLELVPAEEAAPKAPEPKTPKLEFKDGAYAKVTRAHSSKVSQTQHLVGTIVRLKKVSGSGTCPNAKIDVPGEVGGFTWGRSAFELVPAPTSAPVIAVPPPTNLARNRDPDREVQTFKVGDTVRVVCKPKHAPTWNASHMDHLVYRQGVINQEPSQSGNIGVMVEDETREWYFPPNSLMLVKSADGTLNSNWNSSKHTIAQRNAHHGKDGDDMAKEQRVLRCRSFDGTRLGDEDVYFSALQGWIKSSYYDGWIWSSDQKHDPANCWYVVEVLPYDDSFALLREAYGTGDVLGGLGDKATAARAAVALVKGGAGMPAATPAAVNADGKTVMYDMYDMSDRSDMSDIEVRVLAELGHKDAMLYGAFEPERYDKDSVRKKCGDNCPLCRAEKRSSFAGDDGLYDYKRTLAAAIAKLAANGTLRPITLSNTPRSTTSQESTMSNIRIETHTFVNGVKVQDLSQDAIVDIITGAERELAKMKSVNTQTRALKAKISKLEGEIARLVELSDERYAKENPGEAATASADV